MNKSLSPSTELSKDEVNVNRSLNPQDTGGGEEDGEGEEGRTEGEDEIREEKETVPYGCTFADSDGVLSDSDSEESENNNETKASGCDMNTTKTDGALRNSVEDCKIVRTLFEVTDKAKDPDDEHDSESFNPSQSSVNDGSIVLFSDDSQGASQESGVSANNWMQYLPLKQVSSGANIS